MTAAGIKRRAYFRLFGADRTLRSALRPDDLVLDAGCSDGRGSEVLSDRGGTIGADIHLPSLCAARRNARRSPVLASDLRRLPLRDRAVDVVVALDVIEHFEKAHARDVIGEFERVARRLVVLLTPAGFMPQPGTPEEPWQEHRCGFEVRELEDLGYAVEGAGGLRQLRREYAAFRWGAAGQLAALPTLGVTRRHPRHAFYLLAMKRRG